MDELLSPRQSPMKHQALVPKITSKVISSSMKIRCDISLNESSDGGAYLYQGMWLNGQESAKPESFKD